MFDLPLVTIKKQKNKRGEWYDKKSTTYGRISVLAYAFDMESNVRIEEELTGRVVMSGDDGTQMTIAATKSKAIRNCLRRVLGPILDDICDAAMEFVAKNSNVEEAKAKMFPWFAEQGITEADLLKIVKIETADALTPHHVAELRSLANALRDNWVSVESILESVREKPETPPVSKTAEELKARIRETAPPSPRETADDAPGDAQQPETAQEPPAPESTQQDAEEGPLASPWRNEAMQQALDLAEDLGVDLGIPPNVAALNAWIGVDTDECTRGVFLSAIASKRPVEPEKPKRGRPAKEKPEPTPANPPADADGEKGTPEQRNPILAQIKANRTALDMDTSGLIRFAVATNGVGKSPMDCTLSELMTLLAELDKAVAASKGGA